MALNTLILPPKIFHKRLGWPFGIRTDSVESRIRMDSDGFRAAPQGMRYCTVCMGILTPQKRVPDSYSFGRESDSDGFERFQDPKIWKSPTQIKR